MNKLASVALVLAGCLPAYDNNVSAISVDMGAGDGPAGTDGPTCGPSGKFIKGIAYSIETGLATAGVTYHLDGYPEPAFTSMPTDSLGHFSFEIPSCVFGTGGTPRYLIMEGTPSSIPVWRTWLAPAKWGKEETPEETAVHFFENPTDMAKGSKHLVLKELVAAGLFPSEAAFNAGYGYV